MTIRLRRRLAASVLLAALFGLAPGAFGGLTPFLDVFAHLTGHFIGAAIGGLIALAWPRRAFAILGAAAIATLAIHASQAARGQIPTGDSDGHFASLSGDALKIVSFNTWHGHGDHQRIASFLEREKPDLAILYEFGPPKRPLLAALKQQFPYQVGCAERWYCSVVMLSKRPFTRSGTDSRDIGPSPPLVWAEFSFGGRPLTVIGAHIMGPQVGPRGHVKELDFVARMVRRVPGHVIFAGDLNATRWGRSLARFGQRSGLQHMDRFLPSWPAGWRGWPQLAIDHFYVSRDIKVSDVHLGPEAGSDHLPLVGYFQTRSTGTRLTSRANRSTAFSARP